MSAGTKPPTLRSKTSHDPQTPIYVLFQLLFGFPTRLLVFQLLSGISNSFSFPTLASLQIHLIFDEKIKTFRKTLIWGEKENSLHEEQTTERLVRQTFPMEEAVSFTKNKKTTRIVY